MDISDSIDHRNTSAQFFLLPSGRLCPRMLDADREVGRPRNQAVQLIFIAVGLFCKSVSGVCLLHTTGLLVAERADPAKDWTKLNEAQNECNGTVA